MPQIQTPPPMNFMQHFNQAARDSRVTQAEATALKKHISLMELPAEEKQAMQQMVDQLQQATNDSFLFFQFKSGISKEEMAGLQALAQNNRLAGQLLMLYEQATNQKSLLPEMDYQAENTGAVRGTTAVTPGNPVTPASSPAQNPGKNPVPSSTPPQDWVVPSQGSRQSHSSAPNRVNFSGPVAPASELEAQLERAILNYPGNKASAEEARQIARTLTEAGRAMNMSDENIRKMLAVFAHESGGFQINARSNTGARGLGQLTGPAIAEIDRLSQGNGPYARFRDNFVRPGGNRDDLQRNIWTSVAYMHHLMSDLNVQDISDAFVAYNVGPGGYRALTAMGSDGQRLEWISRNISGVSPQQKLREFNTYADLVDRAHQRLFA